MADVLEQVRVCWCRIRRRRWLGLAVTWAVCAVGWMALCLISAGQSAGVASIRLSVVLLVGAAAGLAAALIAGREPVFDSATQLQRTVGRPVLGSVASMAGSRTRATSDHCFAAAGVGLIVTFAALLALQALGRAG